MRNPCKKECPDRNGVCHSVCKQYLDYRSFCNARIDAKMAASVTVDYYYDTERKKRRNT